MKDQTSLVGTLAIVRVLLYLIRMLCIEKIYS